MVGGIVYSVVVVHTILTCQLGDGVYLWGDQKWEQVPHSLEKGTWGINLGNKVCISKI